MVEETSLAIIERIREVDRKDEAQILLEMAGQYIQEYVYQFPMKGGVQRGLSWAGTRELAQLRGNIVLAEPQVTDGGDHWRVVVMATDLQRNISLWGGTHQPKVMRVHILDVQGNRTGEVRLEPDEHAFEKAIAKAQRNAIKNLIPISVQKQLIERLIAMQGDGRGRRGGPQQVPTRRSEVQVGTSSTQEGVPQKTGDTPQKQGGAPDEQGGIPQKQAPASSTEALAAPAQSRPVGTQPDQAHKPMTRDEFWALARKMGYEVYADLNPALGMTYKEWEKLGKPWEEARDAAEAYAAQKQGV